MGGGGGGGGGIVVLTTITDLDPSCCSLNYEVTGGLGGAGIGEGTAGTNGNDGYVMKNSY